MVEDNDRAERSAPGTVTVEPRFFYRLVRGTRSYGWYADLMHEQQFSPEEFQRLCLHAIGATHGGALWQVMEYLEDAYGFKIVHPIVCHLYDLSPADGRGLCGVYTDDGKLLVEPAPA